jgi:hypothetical protein
MNENNKKFIDESQVSSEKNPEEWIGRPLVCHEVMMTNSRYTYKDGTRGRYATVLFSTPDEPCVIRKFAFTKSYVMRNLDRIAARVATKGDGAVAGFIGGTYSIVKEFPFHLSKIGEFITLIPDFGTDENGTNENGES